MTTKTQQFDVHTASAESIRAKLKHEEAFRKENIEDGTEVNAAIMCYQFYLLDVLQEREGNYDLTLDDVFNA